MPLLKILLEIYPKVFLKQQMIRVTTNIMIKHTSSIRIRIGTMPFVISMQLIK